MRFIQTIFRGIGQVMFQNNIYSGMLFLLGIFYNSWLLGLAALAGTIISTATAQILRYPKEEIENGLYGFNGALIGIAILYFFDCNSASIAALIVGSVCSTFLMRFLKKIIAPFTAPFVISAWLMMCLLIFIFHFSFLSSSVVRENAIDILSVSSKSFGQVMFQENKITGVLFLLGILINNKLMAVYALYASLLGSFVGWLLSEPASIINAGLMGYNAILCAIALTGKSRVDFLWITLAIILSTFINIGLAITGIITLTAPFVLTTWIILKLKNIYKL